MVAKFMSLYLHPTAVLDPGARVGRGSHVWHFCHVSQGARIGQECTLGQNVFVGKDVTIGDRVKIQNNVSVFSGVELADEVFVGPSVVFTNVKTPRAFIERKAEFLPTRVERGASLGANATIVCGVTIGTYAMVAAGSVVTRDVPAYALVAGNPARQVGWVNEAGETDPRDLPLDAIGQTLQPQQSHTTPSPDSENLTVPLSDPGAENRRLAPLLSAASERVVKSGSYILGAEVETFEKEAAKTVGAKHGVGCSSATDALWLSLLALDVGKGDEVVTTVYSFFSAAEAILRVGASLKFVDVAPGKFAPSIAQVVAALSPRTKAVVWVHLFGEATDLRELRRVLSERNIQLVEDAAQAFGARSLEGPVGASGAPTCFSFFPTKNLGGLGDGGLVTTSDDLLAARLRRLRVHGASRRYVYEELGGNCRLDALQAAFLMEKLPHLPDYLKRRREHAAAYGAAFSIYGELLRLPEQHDNQSFNQYVILVGHKDTGQAALRDKLAAFLERRGISTQVYYPLPLHQQPALASVMGAEHFVHAARVCETALALPMFAFMSQRQRDYVIAAVQSWAESSRA